MEFKSLILTSNGGIKTSADKFQQANAVNVAIGLGGTGIACLKALKARVYESVEGDDENAETPQYKHIKFLAVDTTDTDLIDKNAPNDFTRSLTVNEFFDLHISEIDSILNEASFDNDFRYKWYMKKRSGQPGISVQNTQNGAAGERQVGRLLLVKRSDEFRSRIDNLIREAERDMSGPHSLNVHIFTGMGGGTGAGTFIDVCYIVQDVLRSISGSNINKQLAGYFFLPDVTLDKGLDADTSNYIKENGFASMKDLEYCMSFAENGGSWKQDYVGYSINTQNPPVNLAHLVSSRSSTGNTRSNGFEYAMNTVTEYVMQYIISTVQGNAAQSFTIKDLVTNLQGKNSQIRKVAGACHNYVAVGASAYGIPFKEINTYIASKIFHDHFEKLKSQRASDINSFLSDAKITIDDILEAVKKDIPFYRLPTEIDNKTWCKELQNQCQSIPDIPDSAKIAKHYFPSVLTPFRDIYWEKAPGARQSNTKDLTADIEKDFLEAESLISLQAKVKKTLIDYCSDINKGPYYAASLLRGSNYSLENKIDGMINEIQGKIKSAEHDCPDLFSVNLALHEFKRKGGRKRAKNYVTLFMQYCHYCTEIETFEDTISTLRTFKEQVGTLFDEYFNRFQSILTDISNAFLLDYNAIQNREITDSRKFVQWIVRINDPKFIQEIDEYVENNISSNTISRFINSFIKNESWMGSNESTIYNFVCEFFDSDLHNYRQNHMISYYLNKLYNPNENTTEFQQNLYSGLINPAINDANPLFSAAPSVNTTFNPTSFVKYAFFPTTVPALTSSALANGLTNNDIYASFNESMLTVLKFASCAPMFEYNELSDYMAKYKSCFRASLHPHMGSKGVTDEMNDNENWKDDVWNIKPYSLLTDAEKKDFESYSEQFDQAIDSGVISFTTKTSESNRTYKDDFEINIYDEVLIDELNELISSGEIDKAIELLGGNFELSAKEKHRLPSIAIDPEYKEVTVRDFFVASKAYRELVQKQTELQKRYNDSISLLKNYINDLPNFIDLLIDGIFEISDGQIKYYSEAKMEDIILADERSTLDKFVLYPYYSAYRAYLTLETTYKDELQTMRQDKRNNDWESVLNAHNTIKGSFDIRQIVKTATVRNKDEIDAIKAFYKMLQDNIDII